MMRPVLGAFGKAVLSQLHMRMLLLTIAPFMLSVVIWGIVLYFSLQPMYDWVHAYFAGHDLFGLAGDWLDAMGTGFAGYVVVPLVAMWLLLPLMILTALVFIALFAMPSIVRHVASRDYPQLERRQGGSVWGSLWLSLYSFIVFALLWIVSLPLVALPPLGLIVQALLWGWLTYKVLAYDALAEHASREEFRALQRRHRGALLLIGTLTGAMGAAPMLLWLGGALSVVLFPVFAAISIWLYVLVFVFTSLWFAHYCLAALSQMRAATARDDATPVQFKDIN
ncbi:EI24 domain-containing protein [Noviherbaspirillum sedimenti]